MDLIGDIYAPEGSPEWAAGMRWEIQKLLHRHDFDHRMLQTCVENFLSLEGWKKLTDKNGRPFLSYTDFCTTPKPFGLGRSPDEIKQIIADCKKASQQMAADENMQPGPEKGEIGRNRCSVRTPNKSRGETAEYIVRRLKRDAPEVAEALARGEYPSARAAGIAAGIVKVPTPLEKLQKAWSKASKSERKEFLVWVEASMNITQPNAQRQQEGSIISALWARKTARGDWVLIVEAPRERLVSFLPLLHGETQILPRGVHPAGPANEPRS
jgi:hypothetical protein